MALPKELARDILPLVNSDSNDMLIQYVNYRIEQLHKELENVQQDRLGYVQGSIAEIKKLLTLREQVQTDAKG